MRSTEHSGSCEVAARLISNRFRAKTNALGLLPEATPRNFSIAFDSLLLFGPAGEVSGLVWVSFVIVEFFDDDFIPLF